MLSKYILNSNWSSLSSNYIFDGNIDLSNIDLAMEGNLNLTITPYLSNLQDLTNNNYSYLILTNQNSLNNIITNKQIISKPNKQICLLANNIVDFLVSDETTFLNNNTTTLTLNNVINLSDDNFFEIDFISSNEAVLYKSKDKNNYYVCVDDINTGITIINKKETDVLSKFELDKIKLSYIFDKKDSNLVFYRKIQNEIFVLSKNVNNEIYLRNSTLVDLSNNDIFVILKISDLPKLKNSCSWVSYKKIIDNDNIDIFKSVNINNNFLIHFEYEKVKNTSLDINFLTLKNQFNIKDNSVYEDLNLRKYNTLITGGNREEGYENISLGYTTDYYTYLFKSDKTTWFHMPYSKNSNYRPNINNLSFFKNGAIAGNSPIFSDKIFKKAANYSSTSNMGNVKDSEQTGIWLCSWLSGGRDSAVWVDRFFNTSSFTPYEALLYNSNVNYTPQYTDKYREGISDVASKITLEPGSWYAYSRLGKHTATKILSGNSNNLLSNQFDSFRNSSNLEKLPLRDSEGQRLYDFDGNSYGLISTEKLNFYNNFNISFFATREDWNVNREYQLFGNYIDNGFGFFNNNYINPVNFYINYKKIDILNNKFEKILTIDIESYINSSNFEIKGIFRRDFNGNFHVITSNNYLLEFNSNGTLVDLLSVQKTGSDIILNVSNNLNYGVILYNDNSVLRIDLFSNIYEDVTRFAINIKPEILNANVCIDSFNYIYLVDGVKPILKGSNLYYKTRNSIMVYNTNNSSINTYISSTENIYGYNFDKNQNTIVLLKDSLLFYNTIGALLSSKKLLTNNLNITAFDLSYNNLNDKQSGCVRFIDSNNNNYCYNIEKDSYVRIDNNLNLSYNLSSNFNLYNFDFSNYNYIQSIISSYYPLPSYNFKIRLFNQFDYEDVQILSTNILGSSLNSGTHHFSINLNTIEGVYEFFIDGVLYKKQTFTKGKYSFSNLFNTSIIFGSVPFYGGILYKDFYKSNDYNTFIADFKIEKFKFYKNSLNIDEIKLLYFEKYPPKDLIMDFNIGSRNYIDTVARTFRHKMQGSKSNIINLIINDSLINDKKIQKRYEMMFLKKLQSILPSYVKVNSIKWENNKDNDEKMLEGNFNVRNTLTNNIE